MTGPSLTGAEHYHEAEQLLEFSTADNAVTAADALVHATLALAAEVAALREHFEAVHRAGSGPA